MVGIDGSEESVNAGDYAIAIAKRHNVELIAVNVLTSDIGYAVSSPGVESPPLTIREIILLPEDEVKKCIINFCYQPRTSADFVAASSNACLGSFSP